MSHHHITVDLSKYYEQHLCTNCKRNVNHTENSELNDEKIYEKYLANCNVRFGIKSLPLCRDCWGTCDVCNLCFIPFNDCCGFESILGNQTTTVLWARDDLEIIRKHICRDCNINNPNYVNPNGVNSDEEN